MSRGYFKPFDEVLENMLECLARLTSCQIGLVTNDYNWIEKSVKGDCEFCRLVQSTEEGRKACDNLSWRAEIVATSFKHNYIYKCKYGLVEIIVPLYKYGKYLGSLYCGNFFDKPPEEKHWEEALEVLPEGLDIKTLKEAFNKVEFLNAQRIYDLQAMLNLTAKSIADLINSDGQSFSAYDRILEYIERNFQRGITLRDLSELSGFNPSYISQMFKKKTGVTLTEFVCSIRVNKAKELLIESDMNIGEVAFIVGFKDQNYFSRIFKMYEKFSPREYRKKLLQAKMHYNGLNPEELL